MILKAGGPGPILLTGATGYVGGRLKRILEERGYELRCMSRRPESLEGRLAPSSKVVYGDVLDRDSLLSALEGVETAFYLIHSMGSGGEFEEQDRIAATNFRKAAELAGVRRIIYLGGLGDPEEDLSRHLRSRQETGRILAAGTVQVIEFRASIILGSGSLSFELVRNLVERLPVMLCPVWVRTVAQPIGIEDVLAYLEGAIELQSATSRVFEIGGPDQVSYAEIMQEYARRRGLRRWLIPVPLLSPRLSSLWLGLVTPIYARVGRKLVHSLRHPTVVRDDSARTAFPIEPRGAGDAIERALFNEDLELAETRWSDALSAGGERPGWGGLRFGSRLIDSRTIHVDVAPAVAFRPIQRIGGTVGWYHADWLWRIRGFLDLLMGGVGVRRGRADPEELRVGDVLDFWRVEEFEAGRRLRLRAEMKVPGRAWLEFEVEDHEVGSTIRQTASFDPLGLAGLAYWYALFPLHRHVFKGMLDAIAAEARLG